MFSRDSENGVTLELEFLLTPCIHQFFTRQIHQSDSSKFSTTDNLRYTVGVFCVDKTVHYTLTVNTGHMYLVNL